MISIGINAGTTGYNKKLKDGGACIITDQGILAAISEERITRNKCEGGFQNSLELLLNLYNIRYSDIDTIVYSSCCEYSSDLNINLPNFNKKIEIQSHHVSHAYSAYYTSPFEEAIILVMDAGGDLLEKTDNPSKWWSVSREQNTYFFGKGNNLEFLNNDFDEPLDIGFGEAFRAFTKYLGWKTEYTSKLMALAGLVNFNPYSGVTDLFYFSKGRLKSKLESNPRQPIKMIKNFASKNNLEFPDPFSSKDYIEEYAQLANFMQTQYEKNLFVIIENLYRKYKVSNLCISGGVGLNCVANGKIFENTSIKNVYIPPACGDQGQCMGNALFGIASINGSNKKYLLESAFLGPEYNFKKDILPILLQNKENYTLDEEQVFYKVAYLLKTGKIGAVHYGRSEFGPRALGNRSILAEPFNLETKIKLNEIKQRENFNPFAICVPVENSKEYFHCHSESPFMQFAFKVKSKYKSILKGIIHEDGSCRIQTIDKERNIHLYSIIKEFAKLTGHPIIINTSLNSNDEPICETFEQSINCFQNLNLDFLLINDVLIHKSQFNH